MDLGKTVDDVVNWYNRLDPEEQTNIWLVVGAVVLLLAVYYILSSLADWSLT